MKKIVISLLIFFGLCFSLAVFAQERIDNFQTIIQINRDSTINVEERILYNFDNLQRHGIFRNVPVHYQARGGNFSLGISDISVIDENNNPYQFTLSDQGNDKSMKIGDPNKLISGTKTYVIKYKISRAINYFKDSDELYWNAIGNEWEIPIILSSAKIILPETINSTKLQTDCFSGTLGSKDKCSGITKQETNGIIKEVTFLHGTLGAREGLTIVVGFPKNIVIKPTIAQTYLNILWDNKIIFLPIIIFIIYFVIWWKKGRDPKGRGTIVAQYEAPDNLTPIEIGTLLDYRVDSRDLSAEIIYLAINGCIKITQIDKKALIFKGKDYFLEALKEEDELENEFDKRLMAALFDNAGNEEKDGKIIKAVRLSEIDKIDFQTRLISIKNQVKQSLFDKGYISNKPKKAKLRIAYNKPGLLIFSVWVLLILFDRPSWSSEGYLGYIIFIATIVILVVFTILMRKRTQKGVITREEVLGLREYIRVAEADRIKFHNAPEKNPQLFEKLLPYAMVFKLEKKWAEQFKNIYITPPSWYGGPMGSSFNSMIFVSSLNSFAASANSSIISASRGAAGGGSGFGGGGFSGGGGGGGGGGSW